jgi:hypothetical protein
VWRRRSKSFRPSEQSDFDCRSHQGTCPCHSIRLPNRLLGSPCTPCSGIHSGPRLVQGPFSIVFRPNELSLPGRLSRPASYPPGPQPPNHHWGLGNTLTLGPPHPEALSQDSKPSRSSELSQRRCRLPAIERQLPIRHWMRAYGQTTIRRSQPFRLELTPKACHPTSTSSLAHLLQNRQPNLQ